MNNIEDLLSSAKTPDEAMKIAKEYGYDVELRKDGELSDDDLENVSGGACVHNVVQADYCVVVRDQNTGEILCVIPY